MKKYLVFQRRACGGALFRREFLTYGQAAEYAKVQHAVQLVFPNAIEIAALNQPSPELYAEICGDAALQLSWQDRLDYVFLERIVAIQKILIDLGWLADWQGVTKATTAFSTHLIHVGNINIVGVIYRITGATGSAEIKDMLDMSPIAYAVRINHAADTLGVEVDSNHAEDEITSYGQYDVVSVDYCPAVGAGFGSKISIQ